MPAPSAPSDREHLKVTVYTPESGLRSPLQLLQGMWADTFSPLSRGFAWRVFVKNVSALHRQSVLGYLWILVPPLANALVWVFLNRSKVLRIDLGGDIPYPLYVLTGNLIWQGATAALVAPIHVVQQEKATISKINVPREALLVAGLLQSLLNAFIPMLLLIPIMFAFRVSPGLGLLLGLGVYLAAVAASYTVGVFLTPIGLLYTDIGQAIPLVSRFWFFITPVAFGIPAAGIAHSVFVWNPATSFLETARSLMLESPLTPELLPFLIAYSAIAIGLLFVSLVVYRLSMPIIIERMSA